MNSSTVLEPLFLFDYYSGRPHYRWKRHQWTTRDFAFENLNLHRLELDVYSFNPKAESVYQKAGFKREGILRDAIMDGTNYADDILMSILEDEWKILKGL